MFNVGVVRDWALYAPDKFREFLTRNEDRPAREIIPLMDAVAVAREQVVRETEELVRRRSALREAIEASCRTTAELEAQAEQACLEEKWLRARLDEALPELATEAHEEAEALRNERQERAEDNRQKDARIQELEGEVHRLTQKLGESGQNP